MQIEGEATVHKHQHAQDIPPSDYRTSCRQIEPALLIRAEARLWLSWRLLAALGSRRCASCFSRDSEAPSQYRNMGGLIPVWCPAMQQI